MLETWKAQTHWKHTRFWGVFLPFTEASENQEFVFGAGQ